MHVHILGICGTFMGGLAVLAQQSGLRVTGCDANVYPPMSTQLTALGIELTEGWDPAQLDLGADIYIVGNVVSRGNPLMEAILERGLPYVSGPQWLADTLLRDRWVLAVAGTHGKTTTTSMLAWILEYAGLAPSFLVGGVPLDFAVSARIGRLEGGRGEVSPFFVIEADEYDTAFFDKRSKFVHYRARTAILNNLEFDHADIFTDIGAIETQFHHFVRIVPRSGLLVVNGRDEALRRVLDRGVWTPVEWFDRDDAWHASVRDGSAFEVLLGASVAGEVDWELLGEHNRSNALAAIAAARHAGVPPRVSTAALGSFRGVKRRMELRGVAAGVRVYDDFAHHPSAIRTTVAGLRKVSGNARIVAVVEPRSNTMKRGVWAGSLADSLAEADEVFCYSADLGWDVAAALLPLGPRAHVIDSLERLVADVAATCRPGDIVLVMSNGGFGGVQDKLLAALAAASAAH